MSKIICDVCGTSYPETATQCPICGCVRPADSVTVAGNTNLGQNKSSGTYTYVKGGRFSKGNVKKRSQGKPMVKKNATVKPEKKAPVSKKSEIGLIIAISVLLLAIVAIVIYIALHFFASGGKNNKNDTNTTPSQTVEQTQDSTDGTTEGTILEIPCEELFISDNDKELVFDKATASLLLNVDVQPENTTDEIVFTSSDESVVTVSKDGLISVVGSGEATITVTCGEFSAESHVVCDLPSDGTEPTDPSDVTYSTDDFKFKTTDFTTKTQGFTVTLYKGDIPVELINWYSDDESVATIADGVVTAVGRGRTTVYGEYGGVKLSCIVRCAFTATAPQETEPSTGGSSYNISHTDVTIKVGQTFQLTLKDESGNTLDVDWFSANTTICTVSGNTVTGKAVGKTTVSVTVDGTTYTCIIYVKNT